MVVGTKITASMKLGSKLKFKSKRATLTILDDDERGRGRQRGDESLERKLHFLISAISEMPDLKLKLIVSEEGASYAVPAERSMVVIQRPGETEDSVMGKAYHEVAHLLFTKLLPETIFKGAKDDKERYLLKMQFNSLEDYRIERAMPKYFPAADYYIKTSVQETLGKSDWPLESMRDVMRNLHFLIGGVDMVRLLPERAARRAVRKAHAYLMGVDFMECRSSEELWPHVLKVFNILGPYYHVNDIPDEEEQKSPEISKGVPSPKYEVVGAEPQDIDDTQDGEGDGARGKGAGERPEDCSGGGDGEDGADGGDEGESPGKGRTKPEKGKGKEDEKGKGWTYTKSEIEDIHTRQREDGPGSVSHDYAPTAPLGRSILEPPKDWSWARPMPVTVRTVSQTNDCCSSIERLTDVPHLMAKGRELGRTLKRELRLKEEAERRRTSGKLDLRELRRQLVQHGEVRSPRIFKRDVHNKHAHTVSILIDFSGSMANETTATGITKLKAAKNAALMLSACLDEMNVKHSIAGFSAVEGALEIIHYDIKPFASKLSIPKLQDFNFITKPTALQNRDSDSIRHAAKLLKSYGTGTKVLFVISDGQPHHPDGVSNRKRRYNAGRNAEVDVMNAIKEAENMGVQVVGIAIEPEAAEFIDKTYRKGFHIGHVDELPQRLLNIYRRTIRPIMR